MNTKKPPYYLINLLPFFLGIAAFFLVAGPKILDVGNLIWLGGSLDPAQHYLGWAHYRNGPWSFPIGLNPNNGIDFSNAIVFSDSIPLLAILFKSFSVFLPPTFQYFGLWTLVCFILQAWFSWKLIGLLSSSVIIRLCGCSIFIFSPPMLMRVGLWTSLASHFLILAALYLNFRPDQSKRSIYWALLVSVSALIHFYLLAMVFALWLANLLDQFFINRKIFIKLILSETVFVSLGLALSLWQAGYFSVNFSSGWSGGYGAFQLNLLAPFDSRGWSYFLPTVPMKTDSSTNGFNFFGLGMLLAMGFASITIVKNHTKLPELFKKHLFLYFCFIGLTIHAISNTIEVGLWQYSFAIPDSLLSIVSLLRASGRMFWPSFYFILFIFIALIVNGFKKNLAIYILALCCICQIADTSAGWRPIRKELMLESRGKNDQPLISPVWFAFASHYQKLIRYPTVSHNQDWQYFAQYAAQNKMATNSVFLARLDESKLESSNISVGKSLHFGPLDPQSLYVLAAWKTIPTPIQFDPNKDLLAWIDGYTVLAPNWKICRECPPILGVKELTRFAPILQIGEVVEFSQKSAGARDFLLNGWAPWGESWGRWSDGSQADMILPIPIAQPRILELHVRAFVNSKHPEQSVELLIDGVPVKKAILTQFDDNQINILLPLFLHGKEFFKLEFKFQNPTSPKNLEIGDDNRILGIGVVSLVFK